MLGFVLGITLVLTILSPIIFTDVFADSLAVNFDKELYDVGDSLTVSGEIFELGMPVIAMSIYDPDGKILSANNLVISSEKTFSKTLILNSPFYEKPGEYFVKFNYGQISESHNFIINGKFVKSEISINVEPEILLLYSEQKQYADQDVIKITGLVSKLDSSSVLIGIYDPFGMPAGFYFGLIDSDLEFTTSFLVKDGVNFRVDGTYSIKAHYGESEAISFFEYSKSPQVIIEETIAEETIAEETIAEETIAEETIAEETIAEETIAEETIAEEIDFKINKPNNLTIKDIELGKLLNQINLKCDSSIFTDTISYYDGLGPALYRLCKFDSSLNFFNESLIDDPNNVEILVNKGSTLGKLGYFSEAIVYYDYAINIDPTFLPAKNNKANALANMKFFDEAITLYNEILIQNPDYVTAQKNLNVASTLSFNSYDEYSDSVIENIPYQKLSLSEINNTTDSKKQKSINFFDEVSVAFSTLGSLFDFLN